MILSVSCIDNKVKMDNSVFRSIELQEVIKEHISEIKNISDYRCCDSLIFISVSFSNDNDFKKMSVSSHSLAPVFRLGFNVVYIGNCFFEGRNILIYDEEEIGEVFLNYNNLQHDSAESFDNKSCNEEIYLNVATYKIEGDTLILLEKRFIPNIKTR